MITLIQEDSMLNPVIGTKRNKPPFRYDIVGSFLRPDDLKDARLQYEQGEITADQLSVIEHAEIVQLVEQQKALGLQMANFIAPGGI
jgi:5-methyltetrahydropteroyltriglutamate--homocysteine methyltransferase